MFFSSLFKSGNLDYKIEMRVFWALFTRVRTVLQSYESELRNNSNNSIDSFVYVDRTWQILTQVGIKCWYKLTWTDHTPPPIYFTQQFRDDQVVNTINFPHNLLDNIKKQAPHSASSWGLAWARGIHPAGYYILYCASLELWLRCVPTWKPIFLKTYSERALSSLI